MTPLLPALTLTDPALELPDSEVLRDSGIDEASGIPGMDWHELAVPEDVEDARPGSEGSDPNVGSGTVGSEPSVEAPGRDGRLDAVGRLGPDGVPPDEVAEPDPETVTPPPDPLPEAEPPDGPADPCSEVTAPETEGSDPTLGSDPPPGSEPAPGRDGNAVRGKEGTPPEGNDGNAVSGKEGTSPDGNDGRDWALAGTAEVPPTSPPAKAPPTAQTTAPRATASNRT